MPRPKAIRSSSSRRDNSAWFVDASEKGILSLGPGGEFADRPPDGKDLIVWAERSGRSSCSALTRLFEEGYEPASVIDLWAEHRRRINRIEPRSGRPRVSPPTLQDAVDHWGLGTALAGPRSRLVAMRGLYNCLRPDDTTARDYGRYLVATIRMERRGIPVAADEIEWAHQHRGGLIDGLVRELIDEVELPFVARARSGLTIDADRLVRWARQHGMDWPRRDGKVDTSDGALKQVAQGDWRIQHLRETRKLQHMLASMDMFIDEDGRNRFCARPLSASTGRNYYTRDSILTHGVTARRFIRPHGRRLAYLDYAGQELYLAAALSGDEQMMADYVDGDPHLTLARVLGLVPEHATKATHERERRATKVAGLSVLYGRTARGLEPLLGRQHAKSFLRGHRLRYPTYWQWVSRVKQHIRRGGRLEGPWSADLTNAASNQIQNFPVQGTGAIALRELVTRLDEADIDLLATLHDAVLIEYDGDEELETARRLMLETVAGMFPELPPIRVDAQEVHEDGIADPRSDRTWARYCRVRDSVRGPYSKPRDTPVAVPTPDPVIQVLQTTAPAPSHSTRPATDPVSGGTISGTIGTVSGTSSPSTIYCVHGTKGSGATASARTQFPSTPGEHSEPGPSLVAKPRLSSAPRTFGGTAASGSSAIGECDCDTPVAPGETDGFDDSIGVPHDAARDTTRRELVLLTSTELLAWLRRPAFTGRSASALRLWFVALQRAKVRNARASTVLPLASGYLELAGLRERKEVDRALRRLETHGLVERVDPRPGKTRRVRLRDRPPLREITIFREGLRWLARPGFDDQGAALRLALLLYHLAHVPDADPQDIFLPASKLAHVGLTSKSTIRRTLEILESRGWIERLNSPVGQPRVIRLRPSFWPEPRRATKGPELHRYRYVPPGRQS